ncbi:hypothetical protein Poly41_29050 [Novipirellula artificiosorum]|uniref:Uncharacterized protein n=1 Tax=Novipirellula artificiosorum TaxID=2528016 RepID=A0A5C6DUI5_9BACT|nr:hypothetical protein Poly41_29050 [Novipirellula artificiosorum]
MKWLSVHKLVRWEWKEYKVTRRVSEGPVPQKVCLPRCCVGLPF